MSTKTTFKRIALVTVAALGFGVMSVAPSSAVVLNPTFTLSAATTTVALGETAKTTLTTAGYFADADTANTTVELTTYPAAATAAQIGSAFTVTRTAVDTGTVYTTNAILGTTTGTADQTNGVTTSGNIAIGRNSVGASLVSGRTTLAVTPTAVGTYTYTVKSYIGTPGSTTLTATQTWTVVVTAPELLASTAFISTTTGSAATVDSTTLTSTLAVATQAAVARIDVAQFQDAAKLVTMNLNATKAVTVTITGAGAVGDADNTAARGPAVVTLAGTSTTAASSHTQDYYVFADGRTGPATITITVGTTVYTKTFTFLGALATLTATASKKNVGVGETMTLTSVGADSNKNATATPTVTAASSDATIASVTASGAVATVTGVKAGTATITITSGTITTTAVVTVLPVTAPKLSWAFDKDSYEAGEKMTLTVTATGVADGARAAFVAAPSANFNVAAGSDTLVASPVFAAGVATYTLYAPANPGKFTLTATVGSAIDTEAVIIAAAGTRTVATLSATVTNPALTAAQEATDAALEAIDAGNNAKDAADQAIEAADAATIAAEMAAEAATEAGLVAVAAAEAAGEIATEALDAANAATDAALSAAEAADAATAAATEAKESADAATAAVAALSAEVTKLMAALTAKVTTLSTLVAKIAKKVKA